MTRPAGGKGSQSKERFPTVIFLIQRLVFPSNYSTSAGESARMRAMSGKASNRLIQEKSPYLLQHAYNPVSWYPWSEEAFREARRTDRPVFLSIGYSACHWCHVMERESFVDEETARLMNETFICIKVDREERPDIDAHYMAVCQLLTGGGGWPLTVILTPDKKPLFAGTYFPRESRLGLLGMRDLIGRVGEAWKHRRSDLLRSSDKILAALGEVPEQEVGQKLTAEVLEEAEAALAGQFDPEFGGFGSAPKFPTPHHLTFLLRRARRTNDRKALAMVEKTLRAMRRGGIYDHLGFGFHRYSTDRSWLVPHFEKMLYDQALLAMAYTEAFQYTGQEEYRRTVEETLTYACRDLGSPEGAFFSSEDADSEGEEGKFYLWELAEIEAALSPSEAALAKEIYNLHPEGNFVGAEGRRSGKNILYLGQLPDSASGEFDRVRSRLFDRRERRPRPLKDTKILADWNGLMVAALAKAAQALARPDYADAAAAAASFILDKMTLKGTLHHRSAAGEVAIPAFLDDYAFLVWGLIELYQATFETGYLSAASRLSEELLRGFWDEKDGGFYFTSPGLHRDLPVRRKEIYDGALPSGNSVMASNLLRLGRILGHPEFEARAGSLIAAFSRKITPYPAAGTQFLCGLDFALGPSLEVVIVGRRGAPDTLAMLDVLRRKFLPHAVVLFRPAEEKQPAIVKLAPFTAEMRLLDGRATAYVCSGYCCTQPTTEPGELSPRLI
jgi:uncharacterized protein